MIRHFYHAYAAGAWAEPVREHAAALKGSGFSGDMTVGMVGPERDRHVLRTYLGELLWPLMIEVEWIERDTGYEQITLDALRTWAIDTPGDHKVLYAHTKGAYSQTSYNAAWRRSMTAHLLSDWRHCADLLDTRRCDTIGCHWLTPETDSAPLDYVATQPYYAGNFWWASAAYLRRLPPLTHDSRFDAEAWIGKEGPRAHDLLPGWPHQHYEVPSASTGRS